MSGGADTKKSPMEVALQNSPSAFFRNAIGRPVVVRLVTGADYHGILALVDGYMNIALEQTEEYVGDQLKARYGDAFIRGNNGLLSFPRSLCARSCVTTTPDNSALHQCHKGKGVTGQQDSRVCPL